jgi:hypothetical protein
LTDTGREETDWGAGSGSGDKGSEIKEKFIIIFIEQ